MPLPLLLASCQYHDNRYFSRMGNKNGRGIKLFVRTHEDKVFSHCFKQTARHMSWLWTDRTDVKKNVFTGGIARFPPEPLWAPILVMTSMKMIKERSITRYMNIFRKLLKETKFSIQIKWDIARHWGKRNTWKTNKSLCALKAQGCILLALKVINLYILLHSGPWQRNTGQFLNVKQS